MSGLKNEKLVVSKPQIAKRKRGRPQKTRVVVKRAIGSKFDHRAKEKPVTNESKVCEPILTVKQNFGRPPKAPIQAPIDLSPRRTRAQKAQMALGQEN